MILLGLYLILINAAGLILMLVDKYKAAKNLWRIPEKVLLRVALAGGGIGVYCGMKLARHKTQHPQFSIGVPVIIVLEVLMAVVIMSLL